MESEWSKGTLGDIADIIMGQSPTGDTCNVIGQGVPLLNGPTEFGGNHPKPVQFTTDPRKHAERNDLLFCVRGSTTGRMNWADQRYAIGRGLAAIRAKKGKDFRYFVRAVIDNNLSLLLASATGSTFPNVSKDQIQGIECAIPPIDEQKRISEILGALDDKIELNRKMNATLEQMARALFQCWFVDFDPVHAKAAGRQPVGMDKATADLFPNCFVDSELGKIPKEWKISALVDEVNITRGCSYKSEELGNSTTAMVTLKSFKRGGGYRPDGLKAYTGSFKPDQIVQAGELVVSYTDVTQAAELIGRPAIISSTEKFTKLVISQDVSVVRSKNNIPISYLYCLMMEESFRAHTYAHSTGTTVLHLSNKALPTFKFAKPTNELISAFNQVATKMLKLIDVNNRHSRSLEAVRDTLLPRLLKGKI